jgi:hypothetical protein
MTTLTQTYIPKLAGIAATYHREKFLEELIPRSCMVVSLGLILAGLSIPVLMAVQLLPISLLLVFVGFGLVAVGGVMTLIFCGEI